MSIGALCFLSAAVALLQGSALANTDVIRLDMAPVRGPVAPTTRKYPISAAPPRIPPEQDPDVFCTDGETPDDVFCDMRRFYGSNVWRNRYAPDVYDVDVDYPDSRRSGVVCTASYERPNRTESPLRLPFSSFKCQGGDDREDGLPPFRVSGATVVRITTRKPDSYFSSCTFTFKNAGMLGAARGGGGGRAKGSGVVMFHHDSLNCVSPVIMDRETTERPAGPPCGNDGRRCRPRNK